MILIAGTASIRPDNRERALRAAQQMSQASEAEDGCLTYRFYVDMDDPNRIFIFEVWASEAALAAHFETAHMARFQQQLPDLLAGQMAIKRYDVTAVTDL